MYFKTYDDYLEYQDQTATVWVCDHCGLVYDMEPPEVKCRCLQGRFREVPKSEHYGPRED